MWEPQRRRAVQQRVEQILAILLIAALYAWFAYTLIAAVRVTSPYG